MGILILQKRLDKTKRLLKDKYKDIKLKELQLKLTYIEYNELIKIAIQQKEELKQHLNK